MGWHVGVARTKEEDLMTTERQVMLVATVGTTAEPIERAMEGVARAFLLYGRPFPGQTDDPLEQVGRLREVARSRGVIVEAQEVADPEHLESALSACRTVLRAVDALFPGTVIADFTGGTKVMSTALAHAALTTPMSVPIMLQYVGGAVRGPGGRVLSEAMRVRPQLDALLGETRAAVLARLRSFDYAGAQGLGETLPPAGRNGFVRGAAAALRLWDGFSYQGAADVLRKGGLGGGMAAAFADDSELQKLAATLQRLHEAAQPMIEAAGFLQSLDGRPAIQGRALEKHLRGMTLLVADAVENAERRHHEGRYADAVLRSYRTVETAVQLALLMEGKNPWGPDKIALNDGYKMVAPKAGLALAPEPEGPLKAMQHMRNFSFLEHGYNPVSAAQAAQALATANDTAATLVNTFLSGASWEQCRSRLIHEV